MSARNSGLSISEPIALVSEPVAASSLLRRDLLGRRHRYLAPRLRAARPSNARVL